ncbi:MAG: ABC transporter ATP-binding protein [Ktedonobacterales bacterium]|nr:ABC transporter ATP-binding protein [Ktedonobacterales bacterium]
MQTSVSAAPAGKATAAHTATDVVIQLRDVTKSYGTVQAVKGIDLAIRRGEIVALLGPNGAGKTTTLTMLLGLLLPTTGEVSAFGVAPTKAISHSSIGAMLQEGKLMPGVKVGEFLAFVRSLHPQPLPMAQLVSIADLGEVLNRRIDRLSGGQTQRVRFAMAIAGDPELLILDEPTAAMDVESRRAFWASMHGYAALGHTVLFATHYLEEAEAFASRLVIIAQGRIIADGTVHDILERYGNPRLSFTGAVAPSAYATLPSVQRQTMQGDRVTLYTRDTDATVRALVASNLPWHNLEVSTADLEETFITLVHQGGAQ